MLHHTEHCCNLATGEICSGEQLEGKKEKAYLSQIPSFGFGDMVCVCACVSFPHHYWGVFLMRPAVIRSKSCPWRHKTETTWLDSWRERKSTTIGSTGVEQHLPDLINIKTPPLICTSAPISCWALTVRNTISKKAQIHARGNNLLIKESVSKCQASLWCSDHSCTVWVIGL